MLLIPIRARQCKKKKTAHLEKRTLKGAIANSYIPKGYIAAANRLPWAMCPRSTLDPFQNLLSSLGDWTQTGEKIGPRLKNDPLKLSFKTPVLPGKRLHVVLPGKEKRTTVAGRDPPREV